MKITAECLSQFHSEAATMGATFIRKGPFAFKSPPIQQLSSEATYPFTAEGPGGISSQPHCAIVSASN